jgi:hypothetical protein
MSTNLGVQEYLRVTLEQITNRHKAHMHIEGLIFKQEGGNITVSQRIELSTLETLKPDTLQKRFSELGWKLQDLAEAVAEQRSEIYGEKVKPVNLRSAIQRALRDPNNATWKTLNCMIKAMDGSLSLRWKKERMITEEVEEEV